MEELNHKIPNLNQNLLQKVQTPPPPNSDRAAYRGGKILAFDAVAILLAGGVGYGCLLYFSGGANLALFGAVATLYLLASFFDYLFNHDRRHWWISALLQIFAFLLFFYAVKPAALLSALVILVLFHFLAHRGAYTLSENSLKLRIRTVARTYIRKIFLGFALAGIILYLPQWNSGNIFIPKPQFERWYNVATDVGQRFYGGVNLKASVGTFAESIARAQLSANPQFQALPSNLKEEALRKTSHELVGSIGEGIGSALRPETPLSEALYDYLSNIFINFNNQFGESFRVAWALALFVVLWSVGTLLIWVVVGLTYLLFEALVAFNVAHIAGESRTKEMVVLS